MPDVKKTLMKLHLEAFTGKVQISKEQLKKTVFFKKGTPVFVDSSVRSETLGQLLLERGKITEEQYRTVLERMHATKRRQGEVIVELGILSAYEVFEALKAQTVTKLDNCFLLGDAEIASEGGIEHLEGITELPADFFRLYIDSFDTHFEEGGSASFPQTQVPDLTARGREYLRQAPLQQKEARLVRHIDGERNFSKLVEATGADPEEAAAFLRALSEASFLAARTPSKPPVPTKPVSGRGEKPEPAREAPPARGAPPRRIIEIAPEAPKASPIYDWVLRCDRPYHELFRVTATTSRAQVERIYENLVRELRLDAIEESYEEKERPVAEKVLDVLTTALAVLGDEKRRQAYFSEVQARTREIAAAPDPAVSAEVLLQKGKIHLGKRRFDQAEELLRKALTMRPEEADYHVELADLLLQRAVIEKKEIPAAVEEELKRAAGLNPTDPKPLYRMGIFHKLKGDLEKARKCLSRVLEMKPKHSLAEAELRLIHRRLEEKRKSGARILSLFKKKD